MSNYNRRHGSGGNRGRGSLPPTNPVSGDDAFTPRGGALPPGWVPISSNAPTHGSSSTDPAPSVAAPTTANPDDRLDGYIATLLANNGPARAGTFRPSPFGGSDDESGTDQPRSHSSQRRDQEDPVSYFSSPSTDNDNASTFSDRSLDPNSRFSRQPTLAGSNASTRFSGFSDTTYASSTGATAGSDPSVTGSPPMRPQDRRGRGSGLRR